MVTMKLHLLILLTLLAPHLGLAHNYQDLSDNEFAEFDELDPEEEPLGQQEAQPASSDDFAPDDDDQEMIIEEDEEFEHFQDPEEFEGFSDGGGGKDEKPATEPKITITKVPIHFRANWDSYWLEILMVAGLVIYFLNFVTGRSKNTQIANAWLNSHRSLLEENFSLVGE